jgi:RNA polymerase sigma factor (sigma-70 family)
MLEKICGNRLSFKSSSMLKSYFFSILENKTKESTRNNRFTTDTIVDTLEGDSVLETNEYDDTYLHVKKEMKKLTSNEQYILTAFYMYDKSLLYISKVLNLSYENCRVIKHRAIKKLMDTVKIQ